MEQYRKNADMQDLAHATAHLIHGSSEGRFKITYAPGHLTQDGNRRRQFRATPISTRRLRRYRPTSANRAGTRPPTASGSTSSPRHRPACGPRAKNSSTAPADLPSEAACQDGTETAAVSASALPTRGVELKSAVGERIPLLLGRLPNFKIGEFRPPIISFIFEPWACRPIFSSPVEGKSNSLSVFHSSPCRH